MGLREKITLYFIVLVILKMSVNCSQLLRKYTNRPCTECNGSTREQSLKYSLLKPSRNLENYASNSQKYGDSIRKEFNFPETEYSGITKCFPRYQEANGKTLSSKKTFNAHNLKYTSQNTISSCYKNSIKNSINVNKQNEQNIPEFSSAPNYRDVANFPDVEYPLCASELWKPNYWNGYLTDTQTNNNLICIDKKLNHSVIEEKPFRNFIKNNKIANICGFNEGPEIKTTTDKDLNVTLVSKSVALNVSSYITNTSNIKECENALLNKDKDLIVLSRPEDCRNKVLPTEDRENEFEGKDEEYTTDDPEYEESSFYAQSTAAPQFLTPNDFPWKNTKVIESDLPNVDELNDYFISV